MASIDAAEVSGRARGREGSRPRPQGLHARAAEAPRFAFPPRWLPCLSLAASMDATHGLDCGFSPLRLLRPTCSGKPDQRMATKGSKGRWARTRLLEASIDAAEVLGRALGREGSRPRPPGLHGRAAKAPRFEPPPRRLPPSFGRGVYGRHARPRPRIRPFAPFAATFLSWTPVVGRGSPLLTRHSLKL